MATTPKVQNNLLTSATTLASQVGAFTPLAQISSVVQSLQNLQGFNPGQFAQISSSIQSALQGFSEASSILSNFAGNSPIGAITSALNSTGLAGSSIAGIAQAGASAYQAADSFLNSVQQADSFSRLSSRRVSVEQARVNNKIADNSQLQFPADIGKYWISLEFIKTGFMSTWGAGPVMETSLGGVVLPVPANLQDNDSLEYSAIQLTDKVIGAAAGVAGTFAADKLKDFQESGVAKTLSNSVEAAGTITGYAVNTNQILKFNQPTLKSHSFSWRLVPSTAKEAKNIHDIIMFIKSKIYPAANMAVFKYPYLVKVALYNANQMYLFRPAYVKGFSVTYNPDGQAFHRDKYPMAVQIDMQIQENSVWTSGDFQGGDRLGIVDIASDVYGQAGDVFSSIGQGISSSLTGGR